MFAVKFEMNGQSVKIKYSHDVFTDSVHETRAGAEAAIRRHYRDFTGDGATIEGRIWLSRCCRTSREL